MNVFKATVVSVVSSRNGLIISKGYLYIYMYIYHLDHCFSLVPKYKSLLWDRQCYQIIPSTCEKLPFGWKVCESSFFFIFSAPPFLMMLWEEEYEHVSTVETHPQSSNTENQQYRLYSQHLVLVPVLLSKF